MPVSDTDHIIGLYARLLRADYLYVSAGYGGNKLVIYDSHTMKKVKTFSMKVPAGIFSHMRARAVVLGLESVLP